MPVAQKFRIYPNNRQAAYMRKAIGHSRFVWNWALGEWNKQYQECKDGLRDKKPSGGSLSKDFTKVWRAQFPWINEVDAQTVRRPFQDLPKAWAAFFRGLKTGQKVGRPRFKCRQLRGSYYLHNQDLKLEAGRVRLGPKAGWMNLRQEIRFVGKPLGARVSFDGHGWYVSIQFEDIPILPKPVPGTYVGVDVGCVHAWMTSEGEVFNLSGVTELERRLKRQQRKLSRRWCGKAKKGHKALIGDDGKSLPKSKRYIKQSLRVAKLHRKITNIKNDAIHNHTSKLVSQYETIFMEDLKVSEMSGKYKSLNRKLMQSSLSEIKRQLTYKSDWSGGNVVVVDPAYTSQRCIQCGHIAAGNRRTQADFECLDCGFRENADLVGAVNICHVGLTGENLSQHKLQQ